MKETTEQKLRQLKLAELMLKAGIDCEVTLHFKSKDPEQEDMTAQIGLIFEELAVFAESGRRAPTKQREPAMNNSDNSETVPCKFMRRRGPTLGLQGSPAIGHAPPRGGVRALKPTFKTLRIRRKDLDAFLDSGATMKATR